MPVRAGLILARLFKRDEQSRCMLEMHFDVFQHRATPTNPLLLTLADSIGGSLRSIRHTLKNSNGLLRGEEFQAGLAQCRKMLTRLPLRHDELGAVLVSFGKKESNGNLNCFCFQSSLYTGAMGLFSESSHVLQSLQMPSKPTNSAFASGSLTLARLIRYYEQLDQVSCGIS